MALLWCASLEAAAASGELIAQFKTQGPIWSNITIADEMVYFGSDDGNLYALDANSHRLVWQFETGDKVRSTPLVEGGVVYFSSDDGYVYALNKQDGKKLWRFDLDDGHRLRQLPANEPPWFYDYRKSSPVFNDGVIYVGSADQYFYAIDAKSGKLRWRFKTAGKIRATASFLDNKVFISSWDGNTYALDKRSGEQLWFHASHRLINSDPKVVGKYVVIGSRNARLYALNSATGEVEWQYLFRDGSWVESSAVATPDAQYFYIGTSDGKKLLKFNGNTGEPVWQFNTQGWSWGAPLLDGDIVYIGAMGADGYWTKVVRGFYGVNAASGELTWQYQPEKIAGYVNGGVFATPAVHKGQLWVADLDGRVRVFTR
ncbi:PQQ-binding-like beta-propeller repeat protein [Motilimonas eburnea]|uniref:outer membrane protein assembly factor BamB family protein n=1 Tax=Motilimonas eburnea TaxID=1737488 RepID=UPI001E5EFA46|nr:PQQ-binding-like beta-propeller repeat protein [Motilimonas eburnea]MCE2572225.1 PQQ-binding-like beta-propeller repeat protein [Motilimonas eburnea]